MIGRTTVLLSLLLSIVSVQADEEATKSEREKLQADIEHSVVAPCCWNMTVDQHDSPASHKVRDQIATMLSQGKTKQEILDYLSSPAQYGERILATPSQKTLLGKSAYWLIPIAMLFGLLVAVMTIRRLSHQGKPVKKAAPPQPKSDQAQSGQKSSWDARVEEELKELD